MIKKAICIFLILSLVACNNSNVSISTDLDGFELVHIPTVENGSIATAVNGKNITETGSVVNGVKQGTWITYHSNKHYPSVIANYMNGILNGAYLTYNTNGQLTLAASCINGEFDGYYKEYENNKVKKEQYFIMGKLDGEVIDYFPRTDKKRSILNYKMGVLEGKSYYYNEAGEIIQEYDYKNGERVEE